MTDKGIPTPEAEVHSLLRRVTAFEVTREEQTGQIYIRSESGDLHRVRRLGSAHREHAQTPAVQEIFDPMVPAKRESPPIEVEYSAEVAMSGTAGAARR